MYHLLGEVFLPRAAERYFAAQQNMSLAILLRSKISARYFAAQQNIDSPISLLLAR